MARRYQQILAAGVRMVAIDVDSPAQHQAMIEKLGMPFPYLSDPDREGVITPLGLANPTDPRNLAIPAIVILDSAGEEIWRWVSRDFADRFPEDEFVEFVASLGLDPVEPEPMRVGIAEPGPSAAEIETLTAYMRGAKFASMAMYMRLREIPEAREQAKAESIAYSQEMDRYIADIKALLASRKL